jgi:hypothetical protein
MVRKFPEVNAQIIPDLSPPVTEVDMRGTLCGEEN